MDMVTQAGAYVDRGWSVIPLREGGMLPVEREWQNRGRRTRAEVEAAWSLYPGANIGIVTGRVSGLWVLDIDPDNGGSAALAGLVQAYGRLPETYVVRTPSGGMHYYFLLPEDFEPRNAQHGRRGGKLPVGIDVRGWHGYVAAPPTSRVATESKRGGTYVVETDFPLSPAPEWLLDLIRPPEVPERVERDEPQEWTAGAGVGAASRVEAVLAVAVPALLGELAAATPGVRNETAFRVAARFWDFISAGWVQEDVALTWIIDASRRCDVDGRFGEGEVRQVWASARRVNAGRPAVLEDLGIFGTVLPFESLGLNVANFSSPATVAAASEPIAGGGTALTFADPAEIGGDVAIETVVDPMEAYREAAISAEMSKQWIREEATRRLRELRSDVPIRFKRGDEIDQIPLPDPLIQGWFDRRMVVRCFGPSTAGKSFVAVDMAACIANGLAWHGARTAKGSVLYVAAEDPAGISLRLRAWAKAKERAHGVTLLDAPLQVNGASVDRLAAAIEGDGGLRDIQLIVLDTQAKVTLEMKENDANDMSMFVAACEKLAERVEATVLVVHHSGLDGDRARGSTSGKAGINAQFQVKRQGRMVSVISDKQKNREGDQRLDLLMNVIDLELVDAFGDPVTSVVLVGDGEAGTTSEGVVFVDPVTVMTPQEKRMRGLVAVLRRQFADGVGGTEADIKAAFRESMPVGMSRSVRYETARMAWNELVKIGRIGRNLTQGMRFKFVELAGQVDDLAGNPDKLDEHGYAILKDSSDVDF